MIATGGIVAAVHAPVAQAAPADPKITVNAAVVRGTTTALAGLTYKLYTVAGSGSSASPYAPGSDTGFFCSIPANASSCTITVTNGSGNRYFLVQVANANTFDVPQYRLNDLSNPKDVFYYVGRTVNLDSGKTYSVPGNGLDQTTGNYTRASTVAAPLKNPSIVQTCRPGLKVAIQMDISTSTNPYKDQYKTALQNLIDGLIGTGTQISLFTFGYTSPVKVSNSNWESPALRNVDTDATAIKNDIAKYTGSARTQATNWDAAYRRIVTANTTNKYDLALFITDGAPNVVWDSGGSGYTMPNNYNVTVRSIDEAVLSANELKNAGVNVRTVGVGPGVQGDVYRNLQAISGLTQGSDYYVGQWDDLENQIKDIVAGANCRVPVTVSKTTIDQNGTTTSDVGGWQFGAAKTAGSDAGVTFDGATPQTSAAGFNGRPKWHLDFTQPTGQSAGVTLTENMTDAQRQAGWALTGTACTVDGNNVASTINPDGKSVTVTGITAASGAVNCTFTNTIAQTGALTITKAFDATVPSDATGPFKGSYSCTGSGLTAATGSWTVPGQGDATLTADQGSVSPTALPVGLKCTVTETSPTSGSTTGLPNSYVWGAPTYSSPNPVTIAANATSKVTVTNRATHVTGSVSWNKTDESGHLLAGSEWTITPTSPSGAAITVIDNGTNDAEPVAGVLKVAGLDVGTYSLKESKAPAGYVLSDKTYTFTISATSLVGVIKDPSNNTVTSIVNVQQTPPTLPLTGGMSTDAFLIGGSALIVVSGGVWLALKRRSRAEA
jgi:LPXTG-motif cell wall-anchored protein